MKAEELIVKTLEVSTCMIPRVTDDFLAGRDTNDLDRLHLYYALTEYGYRFPVPVPPTALAKLRLTGHGALTTLIQRAESLGCHYLQLDSDADVIDGLPQFEW